MRGSQLRNFTPRCERRRGDVLPILSAVSSDVNQTVVRSNPDRVHALERRRDGVDHTPMFSFFRIERSEYSEVCGNLVSLACKVWTDDIPTTPTGRRLE